MARPTASAACHSPRNALGATAGVSDLSGGLMPMVNWYAPDLTSDRETGLASTPLPDVVRLLRTGTNGRAHTSGPMSEVVQHSLQHLRPEDLQVAALDPAAPGSEAAGQARVTQRGRRVCTTCHLACARPATTGDATGAACRR